MYAVIDCETTGIEPWKNELLTISSILLDEKLNEIDRFTGKIKPQYWDQWTPEAEQVHRIDRETAAKFSSSDSVISEWVDFLRTYSDEFRLVAHALPFKSRVDFFDRNFILAWFWVNDRRMDYYSLFPEEKMRTTILKSKKKAQELYDIPNQKLSTWMDKLNIDKTKHHDSEFDAWVCCEILRFQEGVDFGR